MFMFIKKLVYAHQVLENHFKKKYRESPEHYYNLFIFIFLSIFVKL